MSRSRSSYRALHLHSRDIQNQDHDDKGKHCASSPPASIYTELFEESVLSIGDLDPLQYLSGSFADSEKPANTENQSDHSSIPLNDRKGSLQMQQDIHEVHQRISQYDDRILRDAASNAEHTGPIGSSRETSTRTKTSPCPSLFGYGSHPAASIRSTITPMSNPQVASAELSEPRSTPYGAYQHRFSDSDAARSHRHMCTRFGRQPYIHPEDDPTIIEIEKNRGQEVGRIYDAMTRADRARDNVNSIAMKRWVNCAHYKTDLVEAFAHKVFDCLIVQVREGFRGWHHNDYVDDDRKGEKEDREADCMGRLENILDALEREKTICEDVVNSASQIRMFVNAPIAYAARKHQNRVGNSKRGRTKDTVESNTRPTKAKRISPRQTRARSTTASEVIPSRETAPQFHTSNALDMPYYSKRTVQDTALSPKSSYLSPRQPLNRSAVSMPQAPTGYLPAGSNLLPKRATPTTAASMMARYPMSPPNFPSLHPYGSPHVDRMPVAQMSPSISTPYPTYSCHSEAPMADDMEHPFSATSHNTWPETDTFDSSLRMPVDPSLATNDLFYPHQEWTVDAASVETGRNTRFFDLAPEFSHANLADIEQAPDQIEGNGTSNPPDFESYWNHQTGVQPFSFDESHKTEYSPQ